MPKRLTTEEFIERANKLHNDKYDYSKIEYVNTSIKVCIICPKHGEFWQTPIEHLRGQGCPFCCHNFKLTKEAFIEKAKKIHGDKYDYSKVDYVNNKTKVCIVCPKHDEFWQRPNDHLTKHGCPKCNKSKLELEIEELLKENNINYISQARNTVSQLYWLGKLTLDFYLPEYNIAIECQGKQHFKRNCFSKTFGEGLYDVIKERDDRKKRLCDENGLVLLYYSNLYIKYPYDVITNKSQLLENIKYHGT